MKNKIIIYDTTLRDGSQGEGISFSVKDKINITKKLDELEIDYIEGGWPGSNPKDMDYFKMIRKLKLNYSKVVAFGSTRRPNILAEEDSNLNAFIKTNINFVTIFGKSWDFHVLEALKISLEENLQMIKSSIKYLRNNKIEVFYDAEHFFDGYKKNRIYALATIKIAEDAGAKTIILCDTNGGTLPLEICKIVKEVKSEIKIPIGIHCHNDSDVAVANSLIAVENGVEHIQGTINGIGERCGNANLISIISNLQLKMGYRCINKKISDITKTSYYISEIANMKINNNQPFIGKSAFSHKGGIHVSAILKNSRTYEHIDPESIGNKRRVVISELSGVSNLKYKIKEMNLNLELDDKIIKNIVSKIKKMEYDGYQFEVADASLKLLIKKEIQGFGSNFELKSFHVNSYKKDNSPVLSESSIKIKVKNKIFHAASEGNGPVDALNNAIRKSLESFYPTLKSMRLVDYKVRVLDAKESTRSKVRVLIESADKEESWTTIGVSSDIIEASWIALKDSIIYKLVKNENI